MSSDDSRRRRRRALPEPAAGEVPEGRESPRAAKRYRNTVLALILTLTLTAAALTTVSAIRGPHVRETVGDLSSLVQRDGARLSLRVDQPLTDDSLTGLTIEPAADFEATLNVNSIDLRFTSLLDYGTQYRVTAPQLRGLYTGAGAPLDTEFTTPSPDVYTLVRDSRTGPDGQDAPDTVLRHRLTGGGDQRNDVIIAAPRIQEYAIASNFAAAVLLSDGDQTTSLELAALDSDEKYPVSLPGAGSVRQLRGSGSSGFFGFSFTGASGSESFTSTLFIYDTRDVSGVAKPVDGLDGKPLSVIDWRFIPGTTTIVAHSFDGTFLLIDATGARPPSPLGRHSELLGMIPGTTTVAALDADGISAIDLTTGETSKLALGEAPAGAGTYPGRQVIVDPGGTNLQLFSTPLTADAGGPVESTLWRVSSDGSEKIFATAAEGSRIRDFCVSPNRQYAAVEIASADATIDDYPALGGYEGMTTSVFDIQSGAVLTSFYGFLPDWCR